MLLDRKISVRLLLQSRRQNDYVIHQFAKLSNLKFGNIKIIAVFKYFAEFNVRQIFPLYSIWYLQCIP